MYLVVQNSEYNIICPFFLAGAMDTLAPLTLAAGTTALVMYPVDVARALKMASAGGEVFSFGDFVKTHGVRGLASQGARFPLMPAGLPPMPQ